MLEGSINNFFLNLLFISFRFREEILIIFFNVYIKYSPLAYFENIFIKSNKH